VVFKEDVVDELRAAGFTLALALEDDREPRDVRGGGVPCVYVHSGYYD